MTLQSRGRRRHTRKDDKLVTLNVSGRKFSTWESTLKKHPNTLLGSEDLKLFFDEKKKEYFLDRDPHMFRYILNYYRLGKLHLSYEDCVDSFNEELLYFGISIDEVNECCWEEYGAFINRDTVVSCSEGIDNKTGRTIRIRKCIWNLFENTDTLLAKGVQTVIAIFIYLSIIASIVETISCGRNKTCEERYPLTFFVIDAVCMAVFTLEYILRLFASERRWKFIKTKLNILDLLAFVPFYILLCVQHLAEDPSSALKNASSLVVLRILRMFRIFKLSRHSKKLRMMGHALQRSFVDLSFLIFSFLLANVLFASVLYYIEKDTSKQFNSIPESMWYTIITMMTVGYGDVVPITVLGKLVGSVCCLLGIIMLALPIPILQAGAAEEQIQSRKASPRRRQRESLELKNPAKVCKPECS